MRTQSEDINPADRFCIVTRAIAKRMPRRRVGWSNSLYSIVTNVAVAARGARHTADHHQESAGRMRERAGFFSSCVAVDKFSHSVDYKTSRSDRLGDDCDLPARVSLLIQFKPGRTILVRRCVSKKVSWEPIDGVVRLGATSFGFGKSQCNCDAVASHPWVETLPSVFAPRREV